LRPISPADVWGDYCLRPVSPKDVEVPSLTTQGYQNGIQTTPPPRTLEEGG
jgi:hypothetical protein